MGESQQPQEEQIVREPPETIERTSTISPPQTSSPVDMREWVASGIAGGLFALFAFTIGYPILKGVGGCTLPHEILSFIETSVAHEVILLGIILAFYFSERRQIAR